MTTQKRLDSKGLGCCEPSSPATPETVKNRPGLSTIRYRVGTYASFRQAMLELITQGELYVDGKKIEPYPLANWSSRYSDDYGIAILEMWAYVADILTFYQERIANEAFLSTAQQPESLLRMAKMLYYRPAPGKAASAWLVFAVEDGASVKISKELKVQSVPGQDEKPQKFETVEAITADARLNRVRIYAKPQNRDPLDPKVSDRTWAIIDPVKAQQIVEAVSPGDQLVMFIEGPRKTKGKVEEKEVVSFKQLGWYTHMDWTPAVTSDLKGANVYPWVRKFKLFGNNAPLTHLHSQASSKGSMALKWIELITDFSILKEQNLNKRQTLNLDGHYDDLKTGTPILIVAAAFVQLTSVAAVRQSGAKIEAKTSEVIKGAKPKGPTAVVMASTVTQIELKDKLAVEKIYDLRTVTLFELAGSNIKFWNYEYGPLKKKITTVYVAKPQFKSVDKNRVLILDDTEKEPQKVTVTADSSSVTEFGVEHLKITFTPALANKLDGNKAVFYGNVAKATHGETVAGEVLGSGDAATVFQRFTLKKSPVTHVPSAKATSGASNTLEVRVDGVRWQEKTTLYGQSGKARVYTTEIDQDKAMSVRFGDGVTGARLISGRYNITAKYRQGIGKTGQVKAETLTNLLDRPKGLKSVTNPVNAWGAADPEDSARIRKNAPNNVRTFDRVVSLRDFEDTARSYSGVAKARAALIYNGNPIVDLTVAGDNGAELAKATLKDLRAYLDARRDPNRLLIVKNYKNVNIVVKGLLYIDSDHSADAVQSRAKQALQEYFAFANRDLGQPVHLSDIHQVLQAVAGVAGVHIKRLHYDENQGDSGYTVHTKNGLTYEVLQVHLPILTSELAAIDKQAIVLSCKTAP